MVRVIAANSLEELELCLNVRNQVFTLERNVPKEIEVDERDILNSICDHFLIVYHGKTAGALRGMRMDRGVVKLQRFCVLKEYRKKGIGQEAVRLVEEFYKERSFVRIELDSKYEASDFYEKCGYQRVSGLFEEAGIAHVKMAKDISVKRSSKSAKNAD